MLLGLLLKAVHSILHWRLRHRSLRAWNVPAVPMQQLRSSNVAGINTCSTLSSQSNKIISRPPLTARQDETHTVYAYEVMSCSTPNHKFPTAHSRALASMLCAGLALGGVAPSPVLHPASPQHSSSQSGQLLLLLGNWPGEPPCSASLTAAGVISCPGMFFDDGRLKTAALGTAGSTGHALLDTLVTASIEASSLQRKTLKLEVGCSA